MFSSGKTGAARLTQERAALAWSELFRPEVYRRGLALLAALELVVELLAFPQIAHSRALDGGDMDKNILGAVIGLNETIALLRIKPLNRTRSHSSLPLKISYNRLRSRLDHIPILGSTFGELGSRPLGKPASKHDQTDRWHDSPAVSMA